jgi:hypothetical protein
MFLGRFRTCRCHCASREGWKRRAPEERILFKRLLPPAAATDFFIYLSGGQYIYIYIVYNLHMRREDSRYLKNTHSLSVFSPLSDCETSVARVFFFSCNPRRSPLLYIAASPRHYCAQGLRPACKQATSEQAALTPDLCQHVCLCCAERGEVSQSSRHWHVCWRAA